MTSGNFRPVRYSTARTIVCEPGAIRQLGKICTTLSSDKVFLVTDPGILEARLHEAALSSLSGAGISCSIFQDVQADPPEDIVLNALIRARAEKIDTVIGLGGGSSMDVAKLIAALCNSPQALSDAYGVVNLTGNRLPLVQIPTTAGTGSEVTPIVAPHPSWQRRRGQLTEGRRLSRRNCCPTLHCWTLNSPSGYLHT